MTEATVKSMNLLIQKNEARISIKVPNQMKMEVSRNASRMKVSESLYIKLAITDRLEKDDNSK